MTTPDKNLILAVTIGGVVGGITSLGVFCLWKHSGSSSKKVVQRYITENPRASGIVVHDNKVYLSGQVGDIDSLETSDVTAQTQQTLAKIDKLLSQVGVTKSNILEARIWLKNMSRDFQAMNEVWNAWVDPKSKGTRYCVGAELARPTLLVEVQVTAAILQLIMRLKELEGILQQADTFLNPKVHLEQYATSAHIASHMIYTMKQTYGDVGEDKVVADFGCGCGILSVGCAVMGAERVYAIDVDEDALDTCYENINGFELDSNIDPIMMDIIANEQALKRLRHRKLVDVVIMNPPFGTKNNKGIDMKFLQAAINLANHSVYSLHKTSTRAHVVRKAEEMGCTVEVVAELRYDLPKTYKFHKKQSLDVEVDFIRCQVNST